MKKCQYNLSGFIFVELMLKLKFMKHSALQSFIVLMRLLKLNLLTMAGFMFLLLFSANLYAVDPPSVSYGQMDQQNKIKGKITDNEGIPLPGATVTVLGTTRGVITDNDGTFAIDAAPSDKLFFSFIGLESQIVD